MDFIDQHGQVADPVLRAGLFHCCMSYKYRDLPEGQELNWQVTHSILEGVDPLGFENFCLKQACLRDAFRYYEQLGRIGEMLKAGASIDCSKWLEFFTESVLCELQRNIGSISKQSNQPHLESHEQRILVYLERLGSVSLREYSAISTRSLGALQADFERLRRLGLIETVGHGQGRYFVLAEM